MVVAEGVVDLLEAIQIENQQRDWLPWVRLQRSFKPLLEQHAIR